MMLSVIVPTYNCGDYIEECINSITNRLPEQCEVIAVDDGSTDDTRDKLQSLSANCDKLRVLHREHGGPSRARNEGILAAKGRFVTFVDCDDIMHDSFYEKAFRLL
jgi:glycosyltransferase involved in cell wall biosynthesis